MISQAIIREPEVAEYEKIRHYVVSQLGKSGLNPMRLASNRDMAKQFGVSHPTVIKALKDLVDDGYLVVKPGVGTFTNPSANKRYVEGMKVFGCLLADGKTGFMSRGFWHFGSSISENLMARSESFQIQQCLLTSSTRNADVELSSLRLDGLICISATPSIFPAIARLKSSGLPVISIAAVKMPDVSSVFCDFRHNNRKVASLMLSEGRRKLMLMLPSADSNFSAADDAIAGFTEAFAEHGLDASQSSFIMREGNSADAVKIIDAFKPDGMLFNDRISPLWKHLKERLDIRKSCRLYSGALTTHEDMDYIGYIAQPDIEMVAKLAVDNLLAQVENPGGAPTISLPIEMRIRCQGFNLNEHSA